MANLQRSDPLNGPKPEYSSIATCLLRGPLGFGPIQFLMDNDIFFWSCISYHIFVIYIIVTTCIQNALQHPVHRHPTGQDSLGFFQLQIANIAPVPFFKYIYIIIYINIIYRKCMHTYYLGFTWVYQSFLTIAESENE